jgi:Uma2 family endonuclease
METGKPKPATYADIEALPEHLVGEIFDGELYVSPRPGGPHSFCALSLGGSIQQPFGRRRGGVGGWWILTEPELHVEDDVSVPDMAGWRRERMPQVPRDAAFTVIPDWVCEVASPSNLRLDRAIKMPRYARWGVRHLWIVDPLARTLEVYRLMEGRWLQLGVWHDDQVVEAEPFEAVPLDLSELWVD